MPLRSPQSPPVGLLGLVLWIGDSIVRNAFDDAVALANFEQPHGLRVACQAVSGHTIEQQEAVWNSNPLKGASELTGFVYQVGINNTIAGETSASMQAKHIAFLDNIQASNPEAFGVVSLMTPARAYSGMSASDYSNGWVPTNAFLAALSRPRLRICTSASAGLADVNNNLAALYNFGDGLHPNNLGSQLQTTDWLETFYS